MEECGKEEESCCSVCSQVYDTETTYRTKKLSTEDYGTANFYPSDTTYPHKEDVCFLWDTTLPNVNTRKICNAQCLSLLMTNPQYDVVPQYVGKGTYVEADNYDVKRHRVFYCSHTV